MTVRKSIAIPLFCLPVWGQTGTGSIQGAVRDATPAVIPSAAVKAVHADTAREYQTNANETGFYLFPSVQMGKYSLRITAAGMETWPGELPLQVGQRAVVDASLKVGAAATEITVAGDVTPLVTTTSATLGNIVERARIGQLPLNGRFLTNLVMKTTPGIEGSETAAKVYGMRSSSMEFMQDGATLENRDTGDVSRRQPGVDTVEEFRVETNNSSARMTRPASAMIVTKSGSNQVRTAGPGNYGFNWWFNRPGPKGDSRLWPDAPPDLFASLGARGNCSFLIPHLNLALISAFGAWGPNPEESANPHLRLLMQAVKKARP